MEDTTADTGEDVYEGWGYEATVGGMVKLQEQNPDVLWSLDRTDEGTYLTASRFSSEPLRYGLKVALDGNEIPDILVETLQKSCDRLEQENWGEVLTGNFNNRRIKS